MPDLYDVLQQACKNLTGTSGITAANCVEVKDAVDATQMNLQPTTGANVPEAPLCPAGQIPANQFFDNLENTASGNWAKTKVSGTTDFQYPARGRAASGRRAGSRTSGVRTPRRPPTSVSPAPQTSPRRWDRPRISGSTTSSTWSSISTVESSSTAPTTARTGSTPVRSSTATATTTRRSAVGGPLAGRATFTGFTRGYTSSRINLSSLAGQAVRFRFRIGTDSNTGFQGWFIDDIRVYRCVAGSSAPTANAGPNLTVTHNTQFVLNGSGTDPEGKPLAWRWVQLSGTAATIRDPREQAAIVNGVNGGDSGQDLVFQLTVTDRRASLRPTRSTCTSIRSRSLSDITRTSRAVRDVGSGRRLHDEEQLGHQRRRARRFRELSNGAGGDGSVAFHAEVAGEQHDLRAGRGLQDSG